MHLAQPLITILNNFKHAIMKVPGVGTQFQIAAKQEQAYISWYKLDRR